MDRTGGADDRGAGGAVRLDQIEKLQYLRVAAYGVPSLS